MSQVLLLGLGLGFFYTFSKLSSDHQLQPLEVIQPFDHFQTDKTALWSVRVSKQQQHPTILTYH